VGGVLHEDCALENGLFDYPRLGATQQHIEFSYRRNANHVKLACARGFCEAVVLLCVCYMYIVCVCGYFFGFFILKLSVFILYDHKKRVCRF